MRELDPDEIQSLMESRVEADAGWLYDYAVAHPDGFTCYDVIAETGWNRPYFYRVVRQVRLDLAGDEINLPCTPQGWAEPWLYRLVGNHEDETAGRIWTTNRVDDLETRLATVDAMAESLVAGSDGRTETGRKARKIARVVGRLIEDLAEISENSR